MQTLSVREANQNFSKLISEVEKGKIIIITKHGKQVAEQRPVVKDNALAIATVMTVTLSIDHRVVDGALGAEWLQAFKALVEDPISLML